MVEKKWLKKQAAKVRKVDWIDPALYRKYGVKRGLRNDNGTGVLVGLTTIGNVHGYVMNEGEKQPIPGELYYRGINVKDIVAADKREHRFGYEETAYLLLFGELPTARELIDWKNKIGSFRKLSDGFKENAILRNPSKDIMNALARATLFAYAFDPEGNPGRDLDREVPLAVDGPHRRDADDGRLRLPGEVPLSRRHVPDDPESRSEEVDVREHPHADARGRQVHEA